MEKKSAPGANTTPGAHIAKPSGIAVNASVQLSPRTAPRGRGRANAPESLLSLVNVRAGAAAVR